MNICHLATKSFDEDIVIRRSIIYDGTPLTIGRTHVQKSDGVVEETVQFNKSMPDEVNLIKSLEDGRKDILSSPIGSIVETNGNILPLSSVYDYKVKMNDPLSQALPIGATFDDIFESQDVQDYMRDVAQILFPHINPNTNKDDIQKDAFYTPYIPLVALTGCIPPQLKDDKAYFNPNGTVTIAEYLDGLNSIKYGCNANNTRKKTLDNISSTKDYFNEGYNSCIRGVASPFFNLYTREELVAPITRLELAYITVICWTPFIEKFNAIYGGQFYLGISFDWEVPSDVLNNYDDGYDYKVSKVSIDKEHDVVSLNVKDYCSDRTMTEYKEDIKSGASAIPLPMFMSMLELGVMDLFKYENNYLDPLKEVSRGEFCYFLSKLAKLFPTKYKD
jgi:hypothetical protein